MEVRMRYQHCPACRLTVRLDAGDAGGHPCPRCGETLADEPRSLFAEAPPARRFARSKLRPEAVRSVLALRGGRSGRPAA
jgi:hypothetical protein